MSDRTRKYLAILKRIQRLGKKAKKQFIKNGDKEFIDCVSECAKNIVKGNVPLTPRQLRRLHRDENSVRALALKKTSVKMKKTHPATRWFSRGHIATGSRCPRQSVTEQCRPLKIDGRRPAVSTAVKSRQRIQTDIETGRLSSQNWSESGNRQDSERRRAE